MNRNLYCNWRCACGAANSEGRAECWECGMPVPKKIDCVRGRVDQGSHLLHGTFAGSNPAGRSNSEPIAQLAEQLSPKQRVAVRVRLGSPLSRVLRSNAGGIATASARAESGDRWYARPCRTSAASVPRSTTLDPISTSSVARLGSKSPALCVPRGLNQTLRGLPPGLDVDSLTPRTHSATRPQVSCSIHPGCGQVPPAGDSRASVSMAAGLSL